VHRIRDALLEETKAVIIATTNWLGPHPNSGTLPPAREKHQGEGAGKTNKLLMGKGAEMTTKRMKKIMIVVFALLVVGSSISLAQQADDFKGARMGDSPTRIKTLFMGSMAGCRDAEPNQNWDYSCWGTDSIADVKAFVMLFFIGDRLTSIVITFEESDFDTVVAAMKHKYGNSPNKSSNVIRTNAGVKHQNDIYTWKNGQTTITAERFSVKITESSVTFQSEVDLEKRLRRSKDSEKKRAKDM
jgi:hypothetical protein